MESGSCSCTRLEMASKRMKTFHFKNLKKEIKHEKFYYLETTTTEDIWASRKDRHFFKESKLIFIVASIV